MIEWDTLVDRCGMLVLGMGVGSEVERWWIWVCVAIDRLCLIGGSCVLGDDITFDL